MTAHIAPMVSKDWNTPKWILDEVRSFFGGEIDLDPCSNAFSIVEAKRNIVLPQDGLAEEWITDDCLRVFVNPPYGRDSERGTSIYHWVLKASLELTAGSHIIMLVPAATETKHWQQIIWRDADAICFINRRVKFLLDGQEKAGSTSGSALVYFGSKVDSFTKHFNKIGYCVKLWTNASE